MIFFLHFLTIPSIKIYAAQEAAGIIIKRLCVTEHFIGGIKITFWRYVMCERLY